MRYTQPQGGPLQIDRSNPLGAKVIECLPLNGQMVAAVSRAPITLGSRGSKALSPRGYNLRGTGVGGRASIPLDLSKYSKITVAFWLYWDVYANDDALAMELAPSYASNGFLVDPNCSSPAAFMFGAGGGGSNLATFPRPSAGVWHRIALTMDRAGAAGVSCTAYVDGVAQPITAFPGAGPASGNFGSDTLHLLSRNETGLFGTGNLEAVTIYAGVLSAAEAQADYQNPYQIFKSPQRVLMLPAAGAAATYSYTSAGGFVFSGAALGVRSAIKAAAGGLQLSGAAPQARGVSKAPAGGILLAGTAPQTRGRAVAPAGGLTLSGASSIVRSIARAAAGGLKFAGAAALSATAQVQARVITPVGGLLLAGAAAVSRATSRAVSGGITFSGHAVKTAGAAGALLASLLPIFARRRRRN